MMGYETNGMVNYDVNDPRFAAIPANNSWLFNIGNSLSNSWEEFSKMPWKNTPSTYDSKTGVFTQGTPGKYDSMMGFGKDAFNLGKTVFDIMGAMKYGKYVDTQRKALNQNIALTSAQADTAQRNKALSEYMKGNNVTAAQAYAAVDDPKTGYKTLSNYRAV